jgi:prepilin-type N-terminal cleavage/methylation domain-containing protein
MYEQSPQCVVKRQHTVTRCIEKTIRRTNNKVNHRQRGFTLIEVAIVLVIIGLLLGGVVKGQEMIISARARSLIAQQDGIKAAFFGFQDRYRALPGDYGAADSNINCGASLCLNGNSNSYIEAAATGAVAHEEILAWNHLAAAGYLAGNYVMASASVAVPDETNTPKNPYTMYLQLGYDANWGAAGNTINKHNIKTGSLLPVELLAEIDRKVDDGKPYTGAFQFSPYAAGSAIAPDPTTCVSGSEWNVLGAQTNCGAASVL